ncbi:MAG: bifunctional nuclease family protein [Bacteroidales bacterium]|nr:bifunctional nuclease family protein [Bacteroidales bacterium]
MIKLNVLGISYSQTQSGAYALILTEEHGDRRIPIIVGGFEAQAIAIELEGLKPPRPLTHDLFLSFAKVYGITIREVVIYKLEEGVFYAQLLCDNGVEKITLDARTSDAIALAMRFKCPIYTTEEIITKAGIVLDFDKESSGSSAGGEEVEEITGHKEKKTRTDPDEFRSFSIEDLKRLMDEAIRNENYERASALKNEIERRTKK